LKEIGVDPIRDHYYETLFHDRHLLKPLEEDRYLPGLDLRTQTQIEFLSRLQRSDKLKSMDLSGPDYRSSIFEIKNRSFESGGAEFFIKSYSFKTQKIIDIGGGGSTITVRLALGKNQAEGGGA